MGDGEPDEVRVQLVKSRRTYAVMIGGFFAHMACYPQTYTSGSYDPAFGIMSARWWGIAFTALAVGLFLWRSDLIVGTLCSLIAAWSICLAWSSIDGTSQSPAGWLWIAGIGVTLWRFRPSTGRV